MQPPPLVQPEQILPNGLLVTLPYPMARRVEDGDDDRQAAFYGYAASKDAALYFGAYFDTAQIDEVLRTWRSIRPAA